METYIILGLVAGIAVIVIPILICRNTGKAKTDTFENRDQEVQQKIISDEEEELSSELESGEAIDEFNHENCLQEGSAMIITTTPNIEGHTIAEYLGIVCGARVAGTAGGNKMALFGWKNGVHGAMSTIEEEARAIGADAVIGVQSIYINSALCLMGTAVKLRK